MCRHRSIFPGRHQPSIFDADELNFRVRNGNGWTLTTKNTNYVNGRSQILLYNFLGTSKTGDPWESRTPDCGVRGRRLDHLTNGPCRRRKLRSANICIAPLLLLTKPLPHLASGDASSAPSKLNKAFCVSSKACLHIVGQALGLLVSVS